MRGVIVAVERVICGAELCLAELGVLGSAVLSLTESGGSLGGGPPVKRACVDTTKEYGAMD